MSTKCENNLNLGIDLPLADLAILDAVDSFESVDYESACNRAFNEPLDFPPLRQAVLASDMVAIPVEPGLPEAEKLLTPLVDQLLAVGLPPSSIAIVVAENDSLLDENENDGSTLFDRVPIKIHRPDDEKDFAYLSAYQSSHPVLINRTLFEADVVLPVGWTRTGIRPQQNFFGVHSVFVDAGTQARISEQQTRNSEADILKNVNDNLGVFATMQVVDGPGARLKRVLYGERHRVAQEAFELANRCWTVAVEQPHDLVIFTIEGDQQQQNWQSLIDGIVFADGVSTPDATLIAITKISKHASPAITRIFDSLADGSEPAKLTSQQQLVRDHAGEHHLYLCSELARNTVEMTGFGYIEKPEELDRLVSHATSPVLVRDAHRCLLAE